MVSENLIPAMKSRMIIPILLAVLHSQSHGLTSGPNMPEYNDFESLENTDLVNLATGSFTYSLPVMNVPGPGLGFPILLSYHDGITLKQEASWVGLGWNLQAGAITRGVNNVPDDFVGEMIFEQKQTHHVHGWYASISWNVVTVGVSKDTEHGWGGMVGLSYGAAFSKGSPYGLNAGIQAGWNGIYDGVGMTAGVGVHSDPNSKGQYATAGLNIGYHTERGARAGASGGISMGGQGNNSAARSTSLSLMNVGVSMTQSGGLGVGVGSVASVHSSSNIGTTTRTNNADIGITIFTPMTGYLSLSFGEWDVYVDALKLDKHYGFLYSDDKGMDCINANSGICSDTYEAYLQPTGQERKKKMDFVSFGKSRGSDPKAPRFGISGEDQYSVATQGISGSFKPLRGEDGDYFDYMSDFDYEYTSGCQYVGWLGLDCPRKGTASIVAQLENAQRNLHKNPNYSPADKLKWSFTSGGGGAIYTNPDGDRDNGFTISAEKNKITPVFSAKRLAGWLIKKDDGLEYLYTNEAYNYEEEIKSAKNRTLTDEWTVQKLPMFTYAWLLTGIRSTDYVQIGANTGSCKNYDDGIQVCLPDDDDIGGWVRFHYSNESGLNLYGWETPYSPLNEGQASSMGSDAVANNFQRASGVKSIAYLTEIRTPTHKAVFDIDYTGRKDGMGVANSLGKLDAVGANQRFSFEKLSLGTGELTCFPGPPNNPFYDNRRYNYTTTIPDAFPVGTALTYWFSNVVQYPNSSCFTSDVEDASTVLTSQRNFPRLSPNIANFFGKISGYPQNDRTNKLAALNGISLFNKTFDNKEVESVKFTYDYSLAQNTINSASVEADGGVKGRLTLKSVAMGTAKNGRYMPPYLFSYQNNVSGREAGAAGGKESQKYDYWGAYCATCSETKRTPDNTSATWNLSKIVTPSRSSINVSYAANTVDNINGVPVVIKPEDNLSDFFNIESRTTVADGTKMEPKQTIAGVNGFPYKEEVFYSPQSMAVEVQAALESKYLVFMGDLRLDNTKMVKTSQLPQVPPPAYYIVEAPLTRVTEYSTVPELGQPTMLYVEYGFVGLPQGAPTPTPILSSRLTCNDVCVSSVAFQFATLPTEIGLQHNYTASVWNGSGWSRNTDLDQHFYSDMKARVWAVYNSEPNYKLYGSGNSVSELTFRDEIGNRVYTQKFHYENNATATMPQTMSNFSMDINYSSLTGEKAYIGNPGLLHGKTTVEFDKGDVTQANEVNSKSVYHFVTPKNLPTRFYYGNESTKSNGKYAEIKVLDRSSLWGSMWKNEVFDKGTISNGEITQKLVAKNSTEWAYNLAGFTGNPKYTSQLGDLTIDNQDVLVKNNLRVSHSPNTPGKAGNWTDAEEDNFFGATQKIFGHRFIGRACDNLGGADYDACMANNLVTTQVEVINFTPFTRKSTGIADGLKKEGYQNQFDFLTGKSLLSISSNVAGNGTHETYASFTTPAYYQYPGMGAENMLNQEFSNSNYQVTTRPTAYATWKEFERNGQLSEFTQDYNIASASFKKWEDKSVSSGFVSYRNTESFILRERSGYSPPDKNTSGGNWLSQGTTTMYDEFGHEEEFRNSLGVYSSEILGYGKSLPVAFAQNAKRNEIFHQSFETGEYAAGLGTTNHFASQKRSVTGASSLKVANTGGAYVCYDLPDLPVNQTYVASAWYYDEFRGSNPEIPLDPAFWDKTSAVTRPGLLVGNPNTSGCYAETFPNGAVVSRGGSSQVIVPAANGNPIADQRALGVRNWKRIYTEFSPLESCGINKIMTTAKLCLSASEGKIGSDVYYDELRVRPKKSLMTTFTYDANGKITSSADANEVASHFGYDVFGNLSGMKNEEGLILNDQSKKFGKIPVAYSIVMTGEIIEGCEKFRIVADPLGNDASTDFISVEAGKARFEIKTQNGQSVQTFCRETFEAFTAKFFMHESGRIHTLTVGAKAATTFTLTKSFDQTLPAAFDFMYHDHEGCGKYFVIKLPTETFLRNGGHIPGNMDLDGFKVRYQFSGIAQDENPNSTKSIPTINGVLPHNINIFHNYPRVYADFSLVQNGNGSYGYSDYSNATHLRLEPVAFSELSLVNGKFRIDKTVDWPMASVTHHMTSDELIPETCITGLAGKNYVHLFGLARYNGSPVYWDYFRNHDASTSMEFEVTGVFLSPVTKPKTP